MNKKGNVVEFSIFVLVLIALWIFAIGPFAKTAANNAITTNNLTGLQAFLLANLNLAFFIFILVLIGGYTAWASRRTQGGYR